MSNIPIKTDQELEIMAEAGHKLAEIRQKLLDAVKPGIASREIEDLAQKLIKKAGGQPSFAMVPNYDWATCINVNEGIVHGVPNDYQFQKGDLVSIDVGFYYREFHSDCSRTIIVPPAESGSDEHFLDIGRQTLKKAVKAARSGRRVGHISQLIEKNLHKHNLEPIPNLTGHGIGRQLHQAPFIPGVSQIPIKKTSLLKPGMCLAIEIIYTQGGPETAVSSEDNWTVVTKDGKISGIFEETIAIKNDGPLILTK